MSQEAWRSIREVGGEYEVSNIGRVRKTFPRYFKSKKGEVLSPSVNTRYPAVTIRYNKKNIRRNIHVLVAEAFIGPRPKGMVVNHINGDKQDNRVENLEWVTLEENQRHAIRHGLWRPHVAQRNPNAKLKESDIPVIRRLLSDGHMMTAIANLYGVSRSAIKLIRNGENWKTINGIFDE